MNLLQDLDPGLSGIEQLRALTALGRQVPIGQTMGFTLTEIEEGFAVFEGEPGFAVYNPIGTVHDGYAAAILDSACGCAVHAKLAPGQAYTTIELKVAFHKAITTATGMVRCEGRVISFGRRGGPSGCAGSRSSCHAPSDVCRGSTPWLRGLPKRMPGL
jgi:uncharacterized protein (TIGR00369 family)